ncbi:MAG: STAS domain-containing protein, partial [Prolixibacteraceae bacterium]|nr:STAS domain-containing protein [Prolixibacteraceae bacterium]
MLALEKQFIRSNFYLKLDGRLDTNTSSIFDTFIQPFLKSEQFIILDFETCNYLSSTGIRSLLIAEKKLQKIGGHLYLCNLVFEVKQVLEMAGLDRVFQMLDSIDEAIQTVNKITQTNNKNEDLKLDDYVFKLKDNEHKNEDLSIWIN